MPYPSGLHVPTAGLSRLAQRMLPVLYQHRLLSTRQLHGLLQPHATPVYLRRQLGVLRERGLAASTVRRTAGQSELLSYLTPAGYDQVDASGEVQPRAHRMNPARAASQLQEHTLATIDTGSAFVTWARRLGDECGPLDWQPEVAHRLRDGRDRPGDRAALITDAVLRYVHTDGDQRALLDVFLEVDRATEPVATLAAKLRQYARYRTYVPAPRDRSRPASTAGAEAWRERYPAWPLLLLVLTGKSGPALERRIADLRALVAAEPRQTRAVEMLGAGATTLAQLTAYGPAAPIVTPLAGPAAPRPLLSPAPAEAEEGAPA